MGKGIQSIVIHCIGISAFSIYINLSSSTDKFSKHLCEKLPEATVLELAKIYENTSDVLDDFASNAKTLASVLEDVTNGEKITVDQIAQLITLYPKLASEIVKINESRTQGIQIVEKLWGIEKDRSIDYIKNIKAELEAELARLEPLKSAYNDYARAMGVRMAKMDIPKEQREHHKGRHI